MVRGAILALALSVSAGGYATVLAPETTCLQARQDLGNISSNVPQQAQCRSQIDSSARCCAGDTNRPDDCMTKAVSIEGSTGIQNAAQTEIAGFNATIAGLQDNMNRCARELSKVHCNMSVPAEAQASHVFKKALYNLVECMSKEQAQDVALKQQAEATQTAAMDSATVDSAVYRPDSPDDQAEVQNASVVGSSSYDKAGNRIDVSNGHVRILRPNGTATYLDYDNAGNPQSGVTRLPSGYFK